MHAIESDTEIKNIHHKDSNISKAIFGGEKA